MNGNDIYGRNRGRLGTPEEPRKTGFKGNAENAKTRLCTRCVLAGASKPHRWPRFHLTIYLSLETFACATDHAGALRQ
jgi:hypothetical protein